MKLFSMIRLCLAVALFSTVVGAATDAAVERELPVLLTPAKAEKIIIQRRQQGEGIERMRRKAALDTPAFEERVINKQDGQQFIFRRVASSQPLVSEPVKSETLNEEARSYFEDTFAAAQKMQYETISLGANVYGNQYSEITWRDVETGKTVIIWTNISLNYLRPIVSITDDKTHYGYFGFVTSYTQEGEEARITMAKEHGYNVESRWKYPPVKLSSDDYEYFVDAPLDVEIPEKMYRQLDALFGFYLSNEARFRIEHLNSEMLQAARKKDLKENPPVKPKQIIMNYTPLRGEAAK